jgi:hypothetical protein
MIPVKNFSDQGTQIVFVKKKMQVRRTEEVRRRIGEALIQRHWSSAMDGVRN